MKTKYKLSHTKILIRMSKLLIASLLFITFFSQCNKSKFKKYKGFETYHSDTMVSTKDSSFYTSFDSTWKDSLNNCCRIATALRVDVDSMYNGYQFDRNYPAKLPLTATGNNSCALYYHELNRKILYDANNMTVHYYIHSGIFYSGCNCTNNLKKVYDYVELTKAPQSYKTMIHFCLGNKVVRTVQVYY